MRFTTWNVLHRVHALNWGEPSVSAFPDEGVRTEAIAEIVAGWLAGGVDVVCLQEVSGDQLARLREVVRAEAQVFTHCYPRVPRVRGEGDADAGLDDPTEHLVMLVQGAEARLRTAQTFSSDRGKGLLAVDVGSDVLVVDTHVSWGPRGDTQLALLAETAAGASGAAVVLGDFNATVELVQAGLGDLFAPAEVTGPTRIATSDVPGKTIDHVFVRGGTIVSAAVLDARGLSDHHPVTVEIVL